MTDSPTISVFVKLKYWDAYRLNVALLANILRKILYIWGVVAVLWLGLAVLAFFHPAHGQDWVGTMRQASPVQWVLAAPLIIVFVLPLSNARRMIQSPTIKEGIRYQFSDAGIHTETCLSTTDLRWNAIPKVRETRSMFLVFTGPNVPFTLPKWSIENAQDLAALRDLFRAQVKTVSLRTD